MWHSQVVWFPFLTGFFGDTQPQLYYLLEMVLVWKCAEWWNPPSLLPQVRSYVPLLRHLNPPRFILKLVGQRGWFDLILKLDSFFRGQMSQMGLGCTNGKVALLGPRSAKHVEIKFPVHIASLEEIALCHQWKASLFSRKEKEIASSFTCVVSNFSQSFLVCPAGPSNIAVGQCVWTQTVLSWTAGASI